MGSSMCPTARLQNFIGEDGGGGRRMGDAPLVRIAVHPPLEGPLQPGASLSGTLDFRAGREAAAGGAAPPCSEVSLLHPFSFRQPYSECSTP